MEFFGQYDRMDVLRLIAAHLMLGFFLGFLFFYGVFYYFSAPFDNPIPSWLMIIFYGLAGFIAAYLFPDPRIVMASSISLPMLGALFSFMIFISPVFSGDIISSNLSDDMFILARLILISIFLSFLTIFFVGFITLYIFDEEYEDEDSEE